MHKFSVKTQFMSIVIVLLCCLIALSIAAYNSFKNLLEDCKSQHRKLDTEIHESLNRYDDNGKDPTPIAKGMSWVKTNVMLAVNESDKTIADLMTDGCNMGVKSLNKYLNKYEAADENSKDIAKRLINIEEKLAVDIRRYL